METEMFRVSKVVTAGIVAGVVLLGATGQAAAQTPTTTTTVKTTTTSSTSTSTTLLPHPFSAATADCIRQLRGALKDCRRAGTGSCLTQFQTDFPSCFAAGAGVSCAKKCVTKEQTCVGSAPTTKKTCRTTCAKVDRADVKACSRIADGDRIWAGGDAGCLTTAQANLELCRFACSEAELSCRIALRFCVANCANL